MGSLFGEAPPPQRRQTPEAPKPPKVPKSSWAPKWDSGRQSHEQTAQNSANLRSGTGARTPSRKAKPRKWGQLLVNYSGDMSPGEFADMPIDVRELYSPIHVAVASVVEKPADN